MIESTTIEMVSAPPARFRADLQPLLAVAADPVRWRLLATLADGGTHCVCELQPIAGVASNVLSYHLRVLRDAGLVTSARRGRWIDYTLADDARERLAAALPTGHAGGAEG